jgi:iron complex outermembrane receptor protein
MLGCASSEARRAATTPCRSRKGWRISMACLMPCAFVLLGLPAGAAEPGSSQDGALDEVLVEGEHLVVVSEPLLGASSPQSVIDREVITSVVPPTGDFGTIANLSPSYTSSAPNGPGFDAAKGQTLRGFVDGQFNVTMDGIPFADPDNFQHHSTSYFPASMLDRMVIDRSPGSAADLGYASFGGSLNLFSQALPDGGLARVFGSYGSFSTSLVGATVSTARPAEEGAAGILGTVQYTRSNGAMTYSAGNKLDALMKVEALIGAARITLLYNHDRYAFYNPGSITSADLAAFGPSFGYVNDLASPDDYHYSATARSSDFGYLRVELPNSGPWKLTETLYTYSYHNAGLSLKGDQTSSFIGTGFAGIAPTDIAGRLTHEDYRVAGDDLHLAHADRYGTLLAGVWAERAWQNESRVAQDLTTGRLYNAGKVIQSPVYFDFDAHLDTLQPYAQYTLSTLDPLQVRLGVRWRDVNRDLDASVLQNFLPGTGGTVGHRVTATLPGIDASYRISSTASVYAQAARGSLVPSQSFLYTAHPASGDQVSPENALTTQIGAVLKADAYGLGLDAYNINFDNYVSTSTRAGQTFYINSGSARYRGIEAEGHLRLAPGLSLVANGSMLRATFQDSFITSSMQHAGDSLPYAPRYTALAGLLYARGRWGASLVSKFIGTEYQGANGSADGAKYRVGAYSYTDASLSCNLPRLRGTQRIHLALTVGNLMGSDAITDNAGPSILGPTLLNVLPGRSFTGSIIADL